MSFVNRGGSNVRNPPFVVPVQVGNKLSGFIPQFTGFVIDCILSTANKNQARHLFQQVMEQDQQAMGSAVQDLATLTEWVVEEEGLGPNQVETAIRNLVEPVVNAYLAMAVQAYANDFSPIMTQEMANEVQRYQYELNELKGRAQQFFNGGNSRGWGNNGNAGWGSNGGGGNRAAAMRGGNGWGTNNQNQNNRGGNLTNSRWDEDQNTQYQTEANSNWPGNGSNRRSYGGGGGDSVFTDDRPRNAGNREGNTSGTARPRREFNEPRPTQPTRREVAPVSPKVTYVDGQNFFPAREDREWPKIINSERLFDWVLMEDGTQLRPAYQSGWKPSFNPEVPATPLYNPETHILFHMKQPDGTVIETALEREDAMKYLDHELDPKLRQVSREAEQAREGKMAPAWQLVENLRPQPSSPLATSEPLTGDEEGHAIQQLSSPAEFLKTSSLADGIKRASLRLKVDHPGILSKGFELYVDRGVLTTVVNPDFTLLLQLCNADSFKSLFHLLTESNADEELVSEVDKRIAVGVTEALTQNMGLKGWSITSFRDDFGDLLAALKEDYGDLVLPHLENKAIEIISRWLSHYSEKDLGEIRSTVGLADDVVALVWRERSSVTRLPVSSDELKIPVDTGVMVGSTEHPKMYKTLSAIFTRTEDVPFTYHGRYLATTDGVVYAVVNGYLNEEAIVVYKANFDVK